MANTEWIFGLSLDDDNWRWAATQVGSQGELAAGNLNNRTVQGSLDSPPKHTQGRDLHKIISAQLTRTIKQRPDIFQAVKAVGVSTIGVVDPVVKRLVNTRQMWKRHRHQSDRKVYIVDFKALVGNLFPKSEERLYVHNNATAKALAEYDWLHQSKARGREDRTVDLLFFGTFQDGVNGSFVRKTQAMATEPSITGLSSSAGAIRVLKRPQLPKNVCEPVTTLMHQELGHVFPPLHPHDAKYFKTNNSGCAIHNHCYIALASGGRIKKQWKKDLIGVEDNKDKPWEIISYYIAHFCWTAVLTMPPERILLGGYVLFPELIPLIREKFACLNKYDGKPYITYPALEQPDFIDMAALPFSTAGVIGALELSRRAYMNTPVLPFSGVTNAFTQPSEPPDERA